MCELFWIYRLINITNLTLSLFNYIVYLISIVLINGLPRFYFFPFSWVKYEIIQFRWKSLIPKPSILYQLFYRRRVEWAYLLTVTTNDEFELKFPEQGRLRAKPSQAWTSQFIRAETELTLCTSIRSKFLPDIKFSYLYFYHD